MSKSEQRNVVVVGGSKGLGRAVAYELAASGARVTAVARSTEALASLKREQQSIETIAGDATDPTLSGHLLARVEPDTLVLAAGAAPLMRPLSRYDWESFERPFQTDTKLTFHWLRDALNQPLARGGRIVVFSSGAALHRSPLSGGYAAAKQAQRFICNYVRQEAQERELGWRLQVLLPQLNPNTELGAAGVKGYAAKAGESPQEFVRKRFGQPLTPKLAGSEVRRLLEGELDEHDELMLTGTGLSPLPGGK